MQRILLVEDDSSIVRSLTAFLAEEGFSAASAPGERRARELLCEESFDLLLVDISLADGSGFGVCAAAKERGLPVIFLTAFGDEGSVVTGLDMGADDYIAKPFRPRELVSRIRSVLRRCGKSQAVVTLGNVTVDTEKGVATKGGNDLYLSALEYRLLLVFVNNRGKVLLAQQAPRGDLGRRRGLCQRQHAHRLHQAPAREDRGRPAESPDHPHRAGNGL